MVTHVTTLVRFYLPCVKRYDTSPSVQQDFRKYIQSEFTQRLSKNPSYSLRAFAHQLGVNHATLSALLSGKRRFTRQRMRALGKSLGLSPAELGAFLGAKKEPANPTLRYSQLQDEAFSVMADWYFDAILELALVPGFPMDPKSIASSLGIPPLQAKFALETLENLKLIERDGATGFILSGQSMATGLDPDFTSAARKKYQRAILEKSLEALETKNLNVRDHSSTTLAIDSQDLPEVKKLIAGFRASLSKYLQSAEKKPDSVYQLQVSFFPLSHHQETRRNP